MEKKFCQSCGMPLSEGVLGTNADGSKNEDYCSYCYKDGKFIADCSMDEMIEFCVGVMTKENPKLDPSDARKQMQQFFPQLKRWKK